MFAPYFAALNCWPPSFVNLVIHSARFSVVGSPSLKIGVNSLAARAGSL